MFQLCSWKPGKPDAKSHGCYSTLTLLYKAIIAFRNNPARTERKIYNELPGKTVHVLQSIICSFFQPGCSGSCHITHCSSLRTPCTHWSTHYVFIHISYLAEDVPIRANFLELNEELKHNANERCVLLVFSKISKPG